MPRLVLLRHGESVWNRDNLFTGWTDVDLSEQGVTEAKQAARLLTEHKINFDHCFTSVLKRAIRTLWIVLDEMDLMWLPVSRNWRLNERHYGALQGRNKEEMRSEVGKEQVHLWRRSYAVRPPPLHESDPRNPVRERKYAEIPRDQIPYSESLKDTVARVVPYWQAQIAPLLKEERAVLVAAHGNSLRGLIKYLDDISDGDIPGLEIPTGSPLVYDLDQNLHPSRSYYLKAKAAPEAQIPSHPEVILSDAEVVSETQPSSQ